LARKTIFRQNQGFKKQKIAQIGVNITRQIHVSQVDRNDLAGVILAGQTCPVSAVRTKPG
jgi:ferredoxin